ncbi:PaaI family thioesterase [Phenylobacterium sp. J426]|uniref:PaaI family thioesterase n=1 Tax=Phenylobacterium sp. J426 TaxID=2898439 RepID=UPI002150C02C|nr:PaaI family thioesterase [Phenylobacterium sp. J426]MCR5874108.1 PaaI family thioesterase [Phenylobacterium sp. J426]
MDKSAALAAFLERSPYIKFLGMKAELQGDLLTARLPFRKRLIGNPMIPALHGGVIGAFMEMTALAQLAVAEPSRRMPKTIDVTIEYLRPGKPQDLFARADLRKVGRRIANVHVEAWQDSPETPVAALRGHFLLRQD